MSHLSARALNRSLIISANQRRVPLFGSFELTGRCNLSCAMCYVRKSAGDRQAMAAELSAARFIDITRQACEAGLFYLQLTGGEPFLRPDLFDIYHGVSDLGVKITLNSNGTLITPEIAHELGKRPPYIMPITLYGASRETYARLCGNADGFERTLEGIRLLLENKIPIRIHTTLTSANAGDLEGMYNITADFGLQLTAAGYTLAPREGVEACPFAVRLTPKERVFYKQRLAELQGAETRPKLKPVEDLHALIEEDSGAFSSGRKSAFECAAGNFSFVVFWDGRMASCLNLDEPSFVLPPEMPFEAAWERLKTMCDAVPVCEECARCDIKHICKPCPSLLKGETGTFTQKAPLLCEHAELLTDRSS